MKKYFSFIFMTALFAAVISSCEKDNIPTFSVTFDCKGGTPTPATQTVKKGGKVEKPADLTLSNHQFIGWTTADNATSSLWDFEKGTVTADMTLYAKWEQNKYTVIFNSNEGSMVVSQTVSHGEKATKSENPTRNGYRFVAWYKEAELTNEWKFDTDVITADMTLYAKWEQKKYSVTVSSDENGTASASVTSSDADELITITATANSGYRFVEWQVIEGGITLSSATDNPATFIMPDKAVEVKAIFIQIEGLLDIITTSPQGNSIKYIYDSQNRVTRYICSYYITILNYNADGDLVQYQQSIGQGRGYSTTFSKDGNKITFIIMDRPAIGVSNTVNGELELNAQGFPVKLTSEHVQMYWGVVEHYCFYTVTLTWQNGNLIKTEWEREDENGSSAGTVTYTHDDKKIPFYHCNTPKWALWWLDYYRNFGNYGYNENNIKTETGEDGSTTTYEYTYNDDGFPVTRTWVEGTYTLTETYTYK